MIQATEIVLLSMGKRQELVVFGLTSLLKVFSHNEGHDLSILYQRCEFMAHDTVNYKSQFMILNSLLTLSSKRGTD